MSGFTTQSQKKNFVFTFNTNNGKKKSMSFNHSDDYSSELATKLTNIANALVTNTAAFKFTLINIDSVEFKDTTTTTFSEANS